MNCYRVTLATDQVELLAPNAASAALSAIELEPEWTDDDDHPSLTAEERNPSLR